MTTINKVELNIGKVCEFKHDEETISDFAINLGKHFAEYYSACAEHAKVTCNNCDELVTNDDYRIVNRAIYCLPCDMVEGLIALMD